MRAIVYDTYGSADVLRLTEVEKPVPGEDEVLIRVHAVEATKADCEMRSFKFPIKWFWLPLRLAIGVFRPRKRILGGYFAGEIESVGSKVSTFSKGDKVFGSAAIRLGAYGEYISLPAGYTIVPKPVNIGYAEAAAVPLGGLNAIHFMRKASIRAGDRVLINGAGGSIGSFAVQIAKAMGAEVTAVDSGIKEQMLRRIGADHFIDYTKEDFTQSEGKYDVILSMVAKSRFSGCIKALNSRGRYLMANPRLSDMLHSLITNMSGDREAIFAFAAEKPEELLAIKAMIEAGEIIPVVDKVYPMEQVAIAHRRVEKEERLGTVIIDLSAPD